MQLNQVVLQLNFAFSLYVQNLSAVQTGLQT